MDIDRFYEAATKNAKGEYFLPNPLQRSVWEAYENSEGHPALLVRAGTGEGKTEAVLFPALADQTNPRRILMILPSKALIEDMGERVKAIGEKLSENGFVDISITVDMGGSCHRFCCMEGQVRVNTYHRHLFADDIIITTLDKFLFRLFGYGEKIKSYIFPHRIFGSTLGKRPFIIFDEAHEYDGLAFSNFIKLLEALFIKGKDLCVMSATLPDNFVDFLTPVDALSGDLRERQDGFQKEKVISRKKILTLVSSMPEKQTPTNLNPVQMSLFQDSAKTEQISLFNPKSTTKGGIVSTIAWEVRKRYDPSKRIIARTEYISDLIALYGQLKDKNPLIYHGRLTTKQRKKVIAELISRQKKGAGFLVLATSAIEAGCDLDAHLIVTELCNPDSLVQLIGRLNRRYQMEDAELVVVGEKIKPFVSVLQNDDIVNYLEDLKNMKGLFVPEKLEKYFEPPKGDWMGEILFDMLWEYVYEGDLTGKPLWDNGILVTRSWEPAVTLCTGINEKSLRPENPIQVSVSRFSTRISRPKTDNADDNFAEWLKEQVVRSRFSISENGEWHADLKRSFFNQGSWEESHWTLKELHEKFPYSCYETNLLCIIRKEFVNEYFDDQLGYIKLPKIFLRGYRDGFTQYLDYHPKFKDDGRFSIPSGKKYPANTGRVWYLDKLRN